MIAEMATKADVGVLLFYMMADALVLAIWISLHITAAKREILKEIRDKFEGTTPSDE